MNFFSTIARKVFIPLLLLVLIGNSAKSQTTLVLGDIAFTGYNATPNAPQSDAFSFVLLTPVTAGTVIRFTDQAWGNDLVFNGSLGETTVTLTTTAPSLPAGTEIIIAGPPGGAATATLALGGSAGTCTGTTLSLSVNGDQVIAYQSAVANVAPFTFISGIHMNVHTIANGNLSNTDAANWENLPAASQTANSTFKPSVFTTGTNAIWIGTSGNLASERNNARFSCTLATAGGANLNTAAGVRAACNNPAFWESEFAATGAVPTYPVPSGCTFITAPPAPNFTLQPANSTICAGSNTSFTVTANNASSLQWQVDNGGGFANITDNATYSGATTTTLNITATPGSFNGYLYRCVATNGSGSTNSNNATLTVVPLPVNPTLLVKTPATSTVADGTPVSATFNIGSGGTGCTDDYRYTINGGASYLPYTPGSNISTTGLAAGTGVVTIEGRRAACTSLCQASYIALVTWIVTPLPAGATTLNAGDLAFSAYAEVTSEFSFVLLRNIGPGTVVNFTNNGWYSTNVFRTGEETVTWTSNAAYAAGTEIKIAGLVATLASGGSAGTVTGTVGGLNFSATGDQILAYRGTTAAPTFISAIHMNVYVAPGDAVTTTPAAWDGAAFASPASNTNASALPTGLTTGVNAIWIGKQGVSASEFRNAAYGNCAGPGTLGSIATLRATLNDELNWIRNNNTPLPLFSIPTGCPYLGVGNPPNITGQPANSTICELANTSFTIVAAGATSYQWQVDPGSGFVNIINNITYSGATTATLGINAAGLNLNGYLYRCIATNGSGSSISNAATLTVNAIPIAPTLLTRTPIANNVADGTPVSATFSPGGGGTGCTDDFRYTTDGGITYLPYTPGSNISTTGIAAGSGWVFIEGRRAGCSSGCQGVYKVLALWYITPLPAAPTTLNAGDVAFSAYAATTDEFSFVLIKNIGAGTTINFTTNGWYSNNTFRTGEETVTWTAPAGGLTAGTEIKIVGLTATRSGAGAAGTVAGTPLTINPTGDQILAYRGTTAAPTFITAIHMNVYTLANADPTSTTAAAWDGAAYASPAVSVNASALPTGLTTGVNAIWIGTQDVLSSEFQNAAYGNCAGPGVLGPLTGLRAALNNQANWVRNNNAVPGFSIPTGCNYLSVLCPAISVTNPVNLNGAIGAPFSETFTSAGGAPTVTFSTSSALPGGLTLSTAGVLSGTPTASGIFPIIVTATDGNGCTGTGAAYNLFISSCSVTDQTVTALPTSVCTGSSSTITVGASQPGVNYTLRLDPSNTFVAGPTASNGPAINFGTGALAATTTYNVLAETDKYSINLNGGQAGFSIPANAALDLSNNFTMEGWIKPAGNGSFARMFNKDQSYALGISNNQNSITFTRHNAGDYSVPFTFTNGTWYHIACTYVSGTVEFFVNGVSVGTVGAVPSIVLQTATGGQIGSDGGGAVNRFNGNIDNVRIWNSVRTLAQISANQTAFLTSTGNPTLVASWWIIEGAGNAKDYSANAINATALAGTWQVDAPVAPCSIVLTTKPTVTVNGNNTITLSSAPGTNAQTVCINTAITNITYNTTGATGASFSGLPAGVSGAWAANVVTISGTPTTTVGSPFTYTVTLTGGCGTVSTTGTITVNPANTIALTSAVGTDAQTLCINSPLTNITYSTTGATGATFSGLPAGVSGAWAANVVTISGTPTASGTFNYTVTQTGGCPVTANGTITVTANNTITLTSAPGTNTQTACINTAITNITYATTGATGATFSGLPAGVTGNWLANVVTISGSPTTTVGSPFNYTVTLTGGCGAITATGTITVNPNNTMSLTSAPATTNQTVLVNTPITNVTYSTTGATGASFSGLPTGVTGNWAANTVTISGSPSVLGTFNYTITLTGGCGAITANGTINVVACSITRTSAAGTDAQTVCNNTAITNITYATTGATGASFTGLPAGVTGAWAANVATISGTPTVAGTFGYVVTLTGGGCGAFNATGTITVIPTPDVNQPANQVVCNNTPTGAVNFIGSVPGTLFNWTNTQPSIGLAASGTGNIASFTAINAGTAPVVATVTVTPVIVSAKTPALANYPLITGLADATSNFGNVVLQGNPTAPASPTVGNPLCQNGIYIVSPNGQNIVTPNISTLNSADFTISVDFRVSAFGGFDPVIMGGNGFRWIGIYLNGSNIGMKWNNSNTAFSATTVNLNQWYNAKITFTNNTAYLTLDGSLVQTQVTGALVTGSNFNFTTTDFSSGRAFNGCIRNLVISNNQTCTGTPRTFTYTVNPTPTAVATPASQTVCSGSPITTIAITGNAVSGVVYNWTRNNTGTVTGIAANGAGNISGTLTNTTNVPVTVTFTIIPTANGCPGTPVTATVLVNPTPTVNAVANQSLCNGASTTAVNFTGAVSAPPGTVYNWTNSAPSIGLAAAGTGNIASFTATNAGAAPVVATIQVTPSYTNGGTTCNGTPVTFTITVNPTPSVTITANPAAGPYCGTGPVLTANSPQCTSGVTYSASFTNGVYTPANCTSWDVFRGQLTGSYNSLNITSSLGGTHTLNDPATAQNIANAMRTSTPGTWVFGGNTYNVDLGCGPGSAVELFINQPACQCNSAISIRPCLNNANWGGVNAATCAAPSQVLTVTFGTLGGGCTYLWNTGATTQSITPTVSGTYTVTVTTAAGCSNTTSYNVIITPVPDVNQPANQVVCNNTATAAVNFTGSVPGTVYNWTNNTPSIGLAASGTGNIASFTATNATAAPVVATITVTPSFTNGGGTCTGTPRTFTITVNPTPTAIATPASQTVCSATAITTIAITGNAVAGVVYNWTRDNTGTVTGIAANGAGNISGTLTNTTNTPITVTFTITPTANGCPGAAITATVIVNPTPDVNQPANQVVCNGAPTAPVNFTGSVAGTTFNWTNNTPSIGLAASGSGNIASFNAINTGTAPVVATVTVTPSTGATGADQSQLANNTCMAFFSQADLAQSFKPAASSICGARVFINSGSGTGDITIQLYSNLPNAGGVLLAQGTVNGISASQWAQVSWPSLPVTPGNTYYLVFTGTNGALCVGGNTLNPYPNGQVYANAGYGSFPSFDYTFETFTCGVICTGPSRTFTYTVNPTPNATATPNAQTICSGSAITTIVNSGTVPGTVYNWTRDNGIVTGIAASGTGNISGTLTNPTNIPITVTFTVTPSYTNAGVTCTGTAVTATVVVNPIPTVNAVANQVVCNGAPTTAVTFTGSVTNPPGTVYNWTNNTTSIGLAASGTGNIASFTATNATTAPVTATITVTPSYTNAGTTCTGTPRTFTITVNPTATVTVPANAFVCNGSVQATGTYNFSTTATGGTTTYAWTNNNITIGLGGSGTGNSLPTFTATNTGTAPITGTITVTPTFTNGGVSCTGTPSSFSITVNPTPNATAAPASQTICSAATITTIVSSGTVPGTVFNWTRDNTATATGIAASGTGNISGSLTNTTNGPVTVTFTITPTYTNGGTTCTGPTTTATVLVNPLATVNTVPNQVVCNGAMTAAVNFTSPTTGGTIVYNWTNNTTSIGLAASGTGNIASFTAINTGTAPVTATITVTPTYTNGGISCLGTPSTFTITVNPSGQVNQPASQVVCNNTATAPVNFTTTTPGTIFNWTNNTTSIGLAASGTGNIPSFIATNPSNAPVVATVTVTPVYTPLTGGTQTFNYTGAIQTFTVPAGVTSINIDGRGAQGGSVTIACAATGGRGARMVGDFAVTPGEVISVLVGQQGFTNGEDGGGGGGSFVVRTGNVPLLVAGGGGGASNNIQACTGNRNGVDASITTSGTASSNGLVAGGTGGNGGGANVGSGCGGGGFFTDGGFGANPNGRGRAFVNGGAGGTGFGSDHGGFGGGGSGWFFGGNGGGGGGYSGGGTDGNFPSTYFGGGGGGGSFNAGTNQANTAGVQTGNGQVVITWLGAGGTPCPGPSKTFTITVNPTPTVNPVANQLVCAGSPTAAVNFTGFVPGTVYNWTNNNPNIGLAGSGSGNIASFIAVNVGSVPEIATITVTPTYTNAGVTCSGTPITFTITVNPQGQVNQPASQAVCNGAPTAPVNFTTTVPGTVFNWTNNNTTIGLAASGTGNIASFIGTNATNAPNVGTITVTPVYTSGGTSCTGVPQTFTITVNPTPVVNPVANQVVCNGSPTANINFASPVSGGSVVFNWTNNTPSIGLPASGTGDILSFVATNATNVPVTATLTVTMSYTNGGVTCVSVPVTFTITVNPTPTVNQPANQTVCANTATAPVNFTGTVAGTVFTWTNNNTSIGLAASGTGNIASFTALNNTNLPKVATIVVTPSYTNAGVTCSGPQKTFTITVNPIPTVAAVSNKAYCTGATTLVIPFNGTSGNQPGTVYNWTNSNTAIGLAASGTGDIQPFVTTNATNGPLVATITVTPAGPSGCVGTPITFTITVNPRPVVNPVAGQVVCNNTATAAINFTSPTTGPTGALSFQWTNSAPSIGLAANGTGNIASFIATNTGLSPVTALITVTPVYTNAGITCTGTSQTFTIVVNPTPTVNPVANQVVCNGSNTAAVTFTGSVFGTIYNWTNNNTTIGLAASGAGNIASFTAINATNVPQVATITVTPNYSNTVTCPGTPITFTITVNPTPTVNPVANQAVCAGATVTQAFTGAVAGTVYNWTNSNTAIGLAATGTGNLNFVSTNTTGAPLTGTITVTPTYTNGNTTCSGTPTTFTITVNPVPTVNAVSSQVLCNGAATAAVNFTGNVPGTVYSWTNSNTTIGLAASGTGNIASFTATNVTATVQTATITVTPTFTNGATTCTGTPISFTITVNPTPAVNTIANQTVCAGAATTAVTITGPVTPTTYNWTNNNTSIGLAASGTNTIPSFTAINTGNTAVTATITITPVFTNGGISCSGPASTFTITVNPTANVNVPADQLVCNGANTAAINFTGSVAGTTYSWTNNNTAIGLAASGTGNIPSFIATNNTAAPITATITVTPSSPGACTGAAVTFTITVNPTPSVNAIANQSVCAGTATAAVTISGPVAGTVFTWTNDNTSIGLGASGIGNIPSFIAINPTINPVTATITVTATYTNGGISCTGPVRSFTITVNPLPNIVFVNMPQRVCLTDTIVVLNATPAGGTWSGPGVSGNTFSASAAGVGVHLFSYTVTNGSGCTTTRTASVVVNDCIERHNVFQTAIRIWPNPNQGRFSIQFNSDKYKEFKVKIVDATGREMSAYEFKNLVYGQILPFNLSNLAAGQYFLYVYNTQESGVFPIVIVR